VINLFCFQVKRKIALYIDGEIKNKEKENFLKHINSCNKCSYELKLLQETVKELNKLKNYKTPNYIWENIKKSITKNESILSAKAQAGKIKDNLRKKVFVFAFCFLVFFIILTGFSIKFIKQSEDEAKKLTYFLVENITFLESKYYKDEINIGTRYELLLNDEHKEDEIDRFLKNY
jgi:hypothetical protein